MDFPRDVVQRHVHCAVSAAHPRMPGELAQDPQIAFDVERVLPQQVRLQDQRNAFHARVAHLAQPVDVLVRVQLDDRVVVIRRHAAGAHVGDLERTGRG